MDGTAGVYATLRAEEALVVFTRLDRTARGMRRCGDERNLDTLMADLFVEHLTGVAMRPGGTRPADSPAGDAAEAAADGPATCSAVSAVPDWRRVDGCEPWLWSDPPPRMPVGDPDPHDEAWDRLCAEPAPDPTARPTAGDRRSADMAGSGAVGSGAVGSGAVGPGGRGDHAGPAAGSAAGEAAGRVSGHPAHAPPEPPQPAPQPEPPQPAPPPRRLSMPVEVQVVISAATLLGLDDQPGLLRGHGAVPASVVRDIVDAAHTGDADGRHSRARTVLRGLFCDPVDGRLVAMDSKARLFTGGLRDFALGRDQQCRLTEGPVVDVDHVVEHRAGGPTAAGNGQGLGKLAHLLKDHPGVTVRALPPLTIGDGLDHLRVHAPDLEWRLPTGQTLRSAPPPALGPGSDPDPHPASAGERHLAALIAQAS